MLLLDRNMCLYCCFAVVVVVVIIIIISLTVFRAHQHKDCRCEY